jgi:hypothetical protein
MTETADVAAARAAASPNPPYGRAAPDGGTAL